MRGNELSPGRRRGGARVGRHARLTACWLALLVRLSPLVAALGVAGSALAGGPVGAELADGLRGRTGVSAFLHLLAMIVLTADGAVGAYVLVRQLRAGRRLARELERRAVPPSDVLVRAMAAVAPGVPFSQVDNPDAAAFTYGVRGPRIVATSGLVDRLSERQLTAVMAHENAHVEGADPLRALVIASFCRALLHAPALSPLLRCHMQRRELAADVAAARVVGRSALAQALLAVLGTPSQMTGGVATAAIGDEVGLLHARIVQLETGERILRPRLDVWRALASLPAVLLVVGIALTCGQ